MAPVPPLELRPYETNNLPKYIEININYYTIYQNSSFIFTRRLKGKHNILN